MYRGWQMNMKNSIPQEISLALQNYIQKHGLPEQILLEVSDRLEEVQLPEGLNIVKRVVRLPKNIVYVGEEDGQDSE